MARVKRSVHGKKKRREVLAQASGYRGLKKNTYRKAKEQMLKSLSYAYRDRRTRKRDFRRLWIQRINAACRLNGISYSRFINGLKLAEVPTDGAAAWFMFHALVVSAFMVIPGVMLAMWRRMREGGALAVQERTISAARSRNSVVSMPIAAAGAMPKSDSTE